MRVETTRRGLRLTHGGHTVSEVLAHPGPTHSVFDVLAACVLVCAPQGAELAMLGFAGGGTVAALRALGWEGSIVGVDLELEGARLFKRLSRKWGAPVRVEKADALRFLDAPVRYGAVIEDLSIQGRGGDVAKPDISFAELPARIANRLGPRGVAVLNLLPISDEVRWRAHLKAARAPFEQTRLIHVREYENQVLVGGTGLPEGAELLREVNAGLEVLGSELAGTLSLRPMRR